MAVEIGSLPYGPNTTAGTPKGRLTLLPDVIRTLPLRNSVAYDSVGRPQQAAPIDKEANPPIEILNDSKGFLAEVLNRQLIIESATLRLNQTDPSIRRLNSGYVDFLRIHLGNPAFREELRTKAGVTSEIRKGEPYFVQVTRGNQKDLHINQEAFVSPDQLLALQAILHGKEVPFETLAGIYNHGGEFYASGDLKTDVRLTIAALRVRMEGKQSAPHEQALLELYNQYRENFFTWEEKLDAWGKSHKSCLPIAAIGKSNQHVYSLLLEKAVGDMPQIKIEPKRIPAQPSTNGISEPIHNPATRAVSAPTNGGGIVKPLAPAMKIPITERNVTQETAPRPSGSPGTQRGSTEKERIIPPPTSPVTVGDSNPDKIADSRITPNTIITDEGIMLTILPRSTRQVSEGSARHLGRLRSETVTVGDYTVRCTSIQRALVQELLRVGRISRRELLLYYPNGEPMLISTIFSDANLGVAYSSNDGKVRDFVLYDLRTNKPISLPQKARQREQGDGNGQGQTPSESLELQTPIVLAADPLSEVVLKERLGKALEPAKPTDYLEQVTIGPHTIACDPSLKPLFESLARTGRISAEKMAQVAPGVNMSDISALLASANLRLDVLFVGGRAADYSVIDLKTNRLVSLSTKASIQTPRDPASDTSSSSARIINRPTVTRTTQGVGMLRKEKIGLLEFEGTNNNLITLGALSCSRFIYPQDIAHLFPHVAYPQVAARDSLDALSNKTNLHPDVKVVKIKESPRVVKYSLVYRASERPVFQPQA